MSEEGVIALSLNIPHYDIAYDADTGAFTWLKPARGRRALPRMTRRPDGYLTTYVNGRQWLAHRLAWALYYNEEPPRCIDHINRDKADNRMENLRDGSGGVNEWNSKPAKSRFGVPGVRLASKVGNYQSGMTRNKQWAQLYYGPDLFEAICARKSAEERRWSQ